MIPFWYRRHSAHLCVCAGRSQVLVSSRLLFAERDPRVQQLQPGPQAVESFQHVLHAGLKIRLNLEESDQGIRPVREERERD